MKPLSASDLVLVRAACALTLVVASLLCARALPAAVPAAAAKGTAGQVCPLRRRPRRVRFRERSDGTTPLTTLSAPGAACESRTRSISDAEARQLVKACNVQVSFTGGDPSPNGASCDRGASSSTSKRRRG